MDAKSPDSILWAVQVMVDSYRSVWPEAMMAISPHRVSSYWGHISLVDSDLGGNSIFNRKMTELFGGRGSLDQIKIDLWFEIRGNSV